MSSNLVYDRQRSAAASLASVDTPVSHLHLKGRSSIPSLLRGGDSFTITRMESSSGLADRITKVSSVPALLVAVAIKSLARADCQFWVDDKLVPTPYISPFRSNVIDTWRATRLLAWKRIRLRAVSCSSQRPGRYRGRSRGWPGGDLQGVGCRRRSGSHPTDQEHSSLHRATRLAFPSSVGPPESDPRRAFAPKVWRIAKSADDLARRLGAFTKTPCDRVTERESVRPNTALSAGSGVRPFGQPFSRSFKASFGVSAHGWLVQRRIERSQELLMHTRSSLADIADQAGFTDQAAFTRTFRQIVGITPGRWRRDYQGG